MHTKYASECRVVSKKIEISLFLTCFLSLLLYPLPLLLAHSIEARHMPRCLEIQDGMQGFESVPSPIRHENGCWFHADMILALRGVLMLPARLG